MPAGPASLQAARSELSRRLPGQVAASGRAIAHCRSDFGRMIHRTPGLVVRTTSETDVRCCLEAAARHGLPVRVRGGGHSAGGQTLTDGGLVLLNVSRGAGGLAIHDDGTLETPTRNRWAQVERFARRHGRCVPVLGDWLPLSVGGTLAAGGYGVRSLAAGGQVNLVRRLRLILADGTARWCSPTEEPALFQFSLAGLGAVGVIERVLLRTEPLRRYVTLWTFHAPPLERLAAALSWLGAWTGPWPDVFYYTGKRNRLVVGTAAATLGEARAARPPEPFRGQRRTSRLVAPWYPWLAQLGVAAWLARFPAHRRLWSDYVLDSPALEPFLDHVARLRRDGAFADQLRTVYLLGIRTPADAPGLPLAPVGDPAPRLSFGVGLYAMVARGPGGAVVEGRVRDALRSCLARCVELAGRPYLYGWHEPADLVRAAYRAALDPLARLRQTVDPAGRFGSVLTAS